MLDSLPFSLKIQGFVLDEFALDFEDLNSTFLPTSLSF